MFADKFIFCIHIVVLLVGLIVPFVAKRPFLILYSLTIPFIFFHWAINDDTCALTQLECLLTNEPKEKTFMGRVMGPIYSMSDDAAGKLTKGAFFTLWLFVQWRLGLIKELIKSK